MIEKFEQPQGFTNNPENQLEELEGQKVVFSESLAQAETMQDLVNSILNDDYEGEIRKLGVDPSELSILLFDAGNMVSENGVDARQQLAEQFPELYPHFDRVFQASVAAYTAEQGESADNTAAEVPQSAEADVENNSEMSENEPWYKRQDWSHEVLPRTHAYLSEKGGRVGDQIQAAYYINSGLAEHEFDRKQAGQESGQPYEAFNDLPHQLNGIADYVESLAGEDGKYKVETGDGHTLDRYAVNQAKSIRQAGLYIPGYNDLPIAAAVQEATSDMRAAILEKLAAAQTKEDLIAVLDTYGEAGLTQAVISDNYLDGNMIMEGDQVVGYDIADLRASIEENTPKGLAYDSTCNTWADAVKRVRESGGF